MAFVSSLSSILGKRLLLFGLRHIDILDKDPANYVTVDVGRETSLEIRDVGLHVKASYSSLHQDAWGANCTTIETCSLASS